MKPSDPLLHDLTCVVHLHSTHSDGTGSVEQIVAAAQRASVDVVMLTDHDTLAGRSEEGWHGSVLLLVGVEVSPRNHDHTLAFGVSEPIDHRGLSGAEICRAIAGAGGVSFAAHPFSAGSRLLPALGHAMPHTAVAEADGLELWSFVNDTGERLARWRDVLRFVATPDRMVDHPPPEKLEEWDRMCARRRTVALGGLDVHQIGVRVGGRVPLRLMSYARAFRYLRTHVLCEEPVTGELERDRAQVFDALREGRCYIARDSLAPARGFAFWGGGLAMGAETAFDGQELHVRVPRPASLRLLCDGREVASLEGAALDYEASQPGVYRAEARLGGRTWVLSNPIYLR